MVAVGGRDDARQRGAGPAAPAHRRGPVAVALLEVAGGVRPDPEVGDGRDLAVVEAEAARVDLPVRQEPEDLAAQTSGADGCLGLDRLPGGAGSGAHPERGAGGLDRGLAAAREIGRRIGWRVARPRGRVGGRAEWRRARVGRRRRARVGCGRRSVHGGRGAGGALGADRLAVKTAGGEVPRTDAADGPAVAGSRLVADRYPGAGSEGDAVGRVALEFFVLDRGLQPAADIDDIRASVPDWARRRGRATETSEVDRLIRRGARCVAQATTGREDPDRPRRSSKQVIVDGRYRFEPALADQGDRDESDDAEAAVWGAGAAQSESHGGPLPERSAVAGRRLLSAACHVGQGPDSFDPRGNPARPTSGR